MPAKLEHSLDQSLAAVGTDYFDLYLLHWRGGIPLAETVNELERVKKAGKIKAWGVSNFDVSDLEELWRLKNGIDCVANEDLYNLDSRGIEFDLLPLMKQHQLPLIAYSPLAIPKSSSPKHAEENVAAANIELSDDELLALQKEFPSLNKKVPLAVI